MSHEHKVARVTGTLHAGYASPFGYCVAGGGSECNERAHGGFSYRQHCVCGARRTVNVNGEYVEQGAWHAGNGEA